MKGGSVTNSHLKVPTSRWVTTVWPSIRAPLTWKQWTPRESDPTERVTSLLKDLRSLRPLSKMKILQKERSKMFTTTLPSKDPKLRRKRSWSSKRSSETSNIAHLFLKSTRSDQKLWRKRIHLFKGRKELIMSRKKLRKTGLKCLRNNRESMRSTRKIRSILSFKTALSSQSLTPNPEKWPSKLWPNPRKSLLSFRQQTHPLAKCSEK